MSTFLVLRWDQGVHNTATMADAMGDRNSTHIKKAINMGRK